MSVVIIITLIQLGITQHHTGLAWDAALKITKVRLELLSDPDMLLMIEKGIRGGISMISNSHGKANNPYMGKKYNDKEATKYITYLDANNLYGWAMSKPITTDGFKWMSEREVTDWKKNPCILEVSLGYLKDLHELHNDYLLAPERITVSKVEKLILNNKAKYVIHYENLKTYESLGLRITKIHRGIKFGETAWLKQYIDLITNLRAKANNEFEKDFFIDKLMNNSVFCETKENIRSIVDIRLVNSEAKGKKQAAKPNFAVDIHMKKASI